MNQQQNFVIIKKGDEEHRYYGSTLTELVSGGNLNSALFKEEKKPNYIIIVLLVIIYIIGMCLNLPNYQMAQFLFGSIIATILTVHLYIIYEKKFLFVGIVFVGIMLSLTASKLLDLSSFIEIMKGFFKL